MFLFQLKLKLNNLYSPFKSSLPCKFLHKENALILVQNIYYTYNKTKIQKEITENKSGNFSLISFSFVVKLNKDKINIF